VLQKQLRTETDAKKRQRLQALYLLASGQAESRPALAKLLVVHRHTIKAWLTRYEEDGLSTYCPTSLDELPELLSSWLKQYLTTAICSLTSFHYLVTATQ